VSWRTAGRLYLGSLAFDRASKCRKSINVEFITVEYLRSPPSTTLSPPQRLPRSAISCETRPHTLRGGHGGLISPNLLVTESFYLRTLLSGRWWIVDCGLDCGCAQTEALVKESGKLKTNSATRRANLKGVALYRVL